MKKYIFIILIFFLLNFANSNAVVVNKLKDKAAVLGPMIKSSRSDDVQGFQNLWNSFFEQSYGGIPEYGFKAIDPFYIPELVINKEFVTIRFTNINVVGLKFRKFYDLKVDEFSYESLTKENPQVFADLEIKFIRSNKIFTGWIKTTSNTLTRIRCNHKKVTNNEGQTYFDIGPEIIDIVGVLNLQVSLNPELVQALYNDLEARLFYLVYLTDDIAKHLTIRSVQLTHATILNIIRDVASSLPSTTFFSNL